MLFLDVPGVFDYAGPTRGSRITPLDGVAFPLTGMGRRPRFSFSQLYTQPADASIYASPATSRRPVQDSRSGWSRFSFPVGLFHPLQHAGLSRRTLSYFNRRELPITERLESTMAAAARMGLSTPAIASVIPATL